MRFFLLLILAAAGSTALAQEPLIMNISGRKTQSLNGTWHYIMDPYEMGFYDYRYKERKETDREAYWNTDVPDNKTDRKEHGYSDKYTLKVPGDWNYQGDKFLYYEGTVWYQRTFDTHLPAAQEQAFLYFGAVNYKADVYLNGHKLGQHKGGFTPFNFAIPDSILKAKGNFLVVKVDNKRNKDEIPTVNTDWWNYGGITRDVSLIFLPDTHILDYSLQLNKNNSTETQHSASGWIRFSKPVEETFTIEVPELKVMQTISVKGTTASFQVPLGNCQLWSPSTPKLYKVIIRSASEVIEDRIGFRTIEVSGHQLLLNGKPLFLRGISIHEEIPQQGRRAYSSKDAIQLARQVRELNGNMMRLAHYPHNENMTRVADSMGLLVWSEIPVYWTIDFTNDLVLQKAKQQLKEMITRDRNRCSTIIWSVGNETPVHEARTSFMSTLVKEAKALDPSRLIAAALEVHNNNGIMSIDDPLGAYTDIVAVNEYLGWYSGLPDACRVARWELKYDKPLFFSETGAEALSGYHADSLTRWSEEYQEWYYREQVAMMKRMPANYAGMSPWILNDFRSPRRNHPVYQEGWNNKGLFDHRGRKKKAFYVLRAYYDQID